MTPKPLVLSLMVTLGPFVAGCAQSPVSGLFKANPERTETAAREPVVLGSRTAIGTAETSRLPEKPAVGGKAAANRSVANVVEGPRAVPALPVQKTTAGQPASAGSKAGKDTADVPAKSGKAMPGTMVVEEGDTLLKIASRHRVSVSELMAANKLSSLSVTPGQQLVIPKR